MVTSFFKSASLAAVCAVIIYLIFFMPYVIVLSLEAILTFPQKLATVLNSLYFFIYLCSSKNIFYYLFIEFIHVDWILL